MTELSKEQLIQLGDLMSAAVNSDNPAVKSLVDQLLTTVAITEDMQTIRANNPVVALSTELKAVKDELAKLKKADKLNRVKKLLNEDVWKTEQAKWLDNW